MVRDERSAQPGSQIERKTRSKDHESSVLRAATFNLMTTISPVANGRTEVKEGRAKSLDQKSGFEKPFPMGTARIRGVAMVQTKIHKVNWGSARVFHESGAMTVSSK